MTSGVYTRTEEHKQNMKKPKSEEAKQNMKGHTGIYIRTEEHKQKMRIARIEYIQNNTGFPVCPQLGKYEKQILDELENRIGFLIKRSFYINGYYLDGYCIELNLAIEVDELKHYKNRILSQRDVNKQNSIINTLNCKFLRIKVEEVIQDKKVNLIALNNIEW